MLLQQIQAEVTLRLSTPEARAEIVRRVLEDLTEAERLSDTCQKQLILRGRHPGYPELVALRETVDRRKNAVRAQQDLLNYGRYGYRLDPFERGMHAKVFREAMEACKVAKGKFREEVKRILGPDAWGKGQQ